MFYSLHSAHTYVGKLFTGSLQQSIQVQIIITKSTANTDVKFRCLSLQTSYSYIIIFKQKQLALCIKITKSQKHFLSNHRNDKKITELPFGLKKNHKINKLKDICSMQILYSRTALTMGWDRGGLERFQWIYMYNHPFLICVQN